MTIEDLTTYSKNDPNNRFTITASKAIATGIQRGEAEYIYKDAGVGHFSGDFEHLVSAKVIGYSDYGQCMIWSLANVIDYDSTSARASNNLQVFLNQHDGLTGLCIREWYSGNIYGNTDYGGLSYDTEYYLTIARSGSTWTCKIYSDSARTSLITTLSITLQSIVAYRYFYAMRAMGDSGYPFNCFAENINLQEGPISRISQGTSGYATGQSTSSTSIVVTLQQTPVSGNILVAAVAVADVPTSVSSIVDSNSAVTWTKQVGATGDGVNTLEIWVGIVGAGASVTQTVTLGAGSSKGAVCDICEYSGVATSSYLDQSQFSVNGTSNYPATGTTDTTTQEVELWVGATVIYTGAGTQTTPTNSFTLLDGSLYVHCSLAYLEKIVSATGTSGSSTTDTGGVDDWSGCIVTLKAASAPTPLTYSIDTLLTLPLTYSIDALLTLPPTVAIVGTNAKGYSFGGTTVSVTMGQTPTEGNVIICAVGFCPNSGDAKTVHSITQTGVDWTFLKRENSIWVVEIWAGVVGSSAGTGITVTCDNISSVWGAIADAVEFSGLDTSSLLDKTASSYSNGSGTTLTGTTDTTTQADELCVGAIFVNQYAHTDALTTPTNGFTKLDGIHVGDGTYNISLGFLYKMVSAEAAYSSGLTNPNGGSDLYEGCIVTLKAASAPPPPTPLTYSIDTLLALPLTYSIDSALQKLGIIVNNANLVGLWHLDEGSGVTAYDSSGNGNDGTLYGSALPTWVAGRWGHALSFDGIDNNVIVPTLDGYMDGKSSGSICVWFNFSKTQAGAAIAGWWGGHNFNIHIDDVGTKISFHYCTTEELNNVITSSSAYNDGQWHFAVGTYDTVLGGILYIDGSVVDTLSANGTLVEDSTFALGSYAYTEEGPFGSFFNGLIDEVRAYSRALSQAEITALFNTNMDAGTHSIDAVFKMFNLSKTDLMDVILSFRFLRTEQIDTDIKKLGITKTNFIDIEFDKYGFKSRFLDVDFKKRNIPKIESADVILSLRISKTKRIDMLLKKLRIGKTNSMDAILASSTPPTPKYKFGETVWIPTDPENVKLQNALIAEGIAPSIDAFILDDPDSYIMRTNIAAIIPDSVTARSWIPCEPDETKMRVALIAYLESLT